MPGNMEFVKVQNRSENVKESRKEASGQIHILKSGLFKFLICGHLNFRLTTQPPGGHQIRYSKVRILILARWWCGSGKGYASSKP
jgi:hypothetical protein